MKPLRKDKRISIYGIVLCVIAGAVITVFGIKHKVPEQTVEDKLEQQTGNIDITKECRLETDKNMTDNIKSAVRTNVATSSTDESASELKNECDGATVSMQTEKKTKNKASNKAKNCASKIKTLNDLKSATKFTSFPDKEQAEKKQKEVREQHLKKAKEIYSICLKAAKYLEK